MAIESPVADTVTTPCVLCGAIARRRLSDDGRRLWFECSGPRCGDYEITLRALHRLHDGAEREQMRALVAGLGVNAERIVEIVMSGTHEPSAYAVPRRPALRRETRPRVI